MQGSTCVQKMAANRVRHAIMETRISATGNQWTAREFFGQSAALDQVVDTFSVQRWQVTFASEVHARINFFFTCQNITRKR